jgi:hypothetical protein
LIAILAVVACGQKAGESVGGGGRASGSGGRASGSGGFAGVATTPGGRASAGESNTAGANAGSSSALGGTSAQVAGASNSGGVAAAGGAFVAAGAAGRAANDAGEGGRRAMGGAGADAGGRAAGGATANAGVAGIATGGVPGAGGAASTTDATIVPDSSWACGLPDGIPPPTHGELLFSASIKVNDVHDVGVTPYGHRRIVDLGAGTLTGDRLSGTLTNGASNFELTLSNDVVELEQVGVIKAKDGTLIYVRGCGVAAPGDGTGRVVLDFEAATSSSFSWLNTGKYVATSVLDENAGTLTLTAYDMTNVAVADPKVALAVPAGAAHQPWDCSTLTGSKGSSVFTEQVGIGSSLSVGASKNGTRNVIPITGGTVTGKVTGNVVAGGADYQLLGGTTRLDARYSIATNDNEFILIRNCGPIGSLVPTFETRADGPYAFLNANTFVSSDPGGGGNGVSITFYERQ